MGHVIYQQPSSSSHQQRYQNNKNFRSHNTGGKIIGRTIAAVIGLYITYFVLAAAYSAVFILTVGSLTALIVSITHEAEPIVFNNILVEGICGAVVGLIVGMIRRVFKIRQKLGVSVQDIADDFSRYGN